MDYRADLHCHSTCSDGTCTPEEILHLAKEKELSGVSITDHDTLGAYTPELFKLAEELGIDLFVGAEFSARHLDMSVHLLGYGMEFTEELLAFSEKHQERRKERNKAILSKLKRLSFPIDEKKLMCASSAARGSQPLEHQKKPPNYGSLFKAQGCRLDN